MNGKKLEDFDGQISLDKTHETNFITVKKEGYGEKTITFNREIWPPWFAANLVWVPAYPIAILVDVFSGSIYSFQPEEAYVVMRKKKETAQ